jgi:hypothetical protein|tara:strand:+ start:1706 stop:1993 length:288 start_codon:yes stop_codon:yes gene_type:complete
MMLGKITRLNIILLLTSLLLCISSCKETKDMVTNHNFDKIQVTPELLDYFSNPRITRYSYYIEESDTCQMALKEGTVYISYAQGKHGIVVNVVVK